MELKLNPGDLLGNYQILEQTGKNGEFIAMGLENKTKIKAKVLLKEKINSELLKTNIMALMNSMNENIIVPLDIIEDERSLTIIYEDDYGNTLDNYVKANKNLNENEAKGILRQIINGYKEYYNLKIAHGYIDPDNIYLCCRNKDELNVCLGNCDGILEMAHNGDYVAPESLCGEKNCLSDIWSIGSTMYYMVNGSSPSEDNKELPAPETQLSKTCADLLHSCLQVDPQKRISFENLISHPFFEKESEIQYNEESIEFTNEFYELPINRSIDTNGIKKLFKGTFCISIENPYFCNCDNDPEVLLSCKDLMCIGCVAKSRLNSDVGNFNEITIKCSKCEDDSKISNFLINIATIKLHCGCILDENNDLLYCITNLLDLEGHSKFAIRNRIR